MNSKAILSLLLFLLFFSCQKNYYLDELREAETTIEELNLLKTRLNTRIDNLVRENNFVLNNNSELSANLFQLQTDLLSSNISLEVAETLLNELSKQLVFNNGIDDGNYKRIKVKIADNLNELGESSFIEDDPLYTSYYTIVDSLIQFWGITYKTSIYNSLPYFQEINFANSFYFNRTVLDQRLINERDFLLTLKIIINKDKDNEKTQYAQLVLSPTGSIPYVNNRNEDLLAQYRLLGTGFFSDPIYGQIDLFDPYSHFKAFKLDALRHGVNLNHLNKEEFELIWESDDFQLSAGYAFEVCDFNRLGVGLRRSNWEKVIVTDFSEYRIQLMWHEFGHSILSLQHLCQGGHIMTGRHQDPQIINNNDECETPNVNVFRLVYDHNAPYYNFQRAVKDMFEGYMQKEFDCSSGKQRIIYD